LCHHSWNLLKILKVADFNNSDIYEKFNIHDDFYDYLPADIVDINFKKSIIPKSSQEEKR